MIALALESNLNINALGSPISAILRSKPGKSKWSLEEHNDREVDRV
jgi:hypothetical protein